MEENKTNTQQTTTTEHECENEQHAQEIAEPENAPSNAPTPAINILAALLVAVIGAALIYIICGNPIVRTYYYFMALGEVLFMYLIYLIFRRAVVRHHKAQRIKSFLFYLIKFLAAALGNAFVTEIGRNSDPYTIAPSVFNFLGIWIVPIAVFIIADRIRFSYQDKKMSQP